jgi:hypothetical protein
VNQVVNGATPLAFSCNPTTGPTKVGVQYSTICTAPGGTPPHLFSRAVPLPRGLNAGQASLTTSTVSRTPTPGRQLLIHHDRYGRDHPGEEYRIRTVHRNHRCGNHSHYDNPDGVPQPSHSGAERDPFATVSPGSPFGSVTFQDGGTVLGTRVLTNGQTSLTVSTLSTGTHSLTASCPGDSSNAASTSAPVTEVTNGALTPTSPGVRPRSQSGSSSRPFFTAAFFGLLRPDRDGPSMVSLAGFILFISVNESILSNSEIGQSPIFTRRPRTECEGYADDEMVAPGPRRRSLLTTHGFGLAHQFIPAN